MDFLMHTKMASGERFVDRQRMLQEAEGKGRPPVDADTFVVDMRGKEPPVVRRWDPIADHFSVHHGLSKEEEDRVIWLVRGTYES